MMVNITNVVICRVYVANVVGPIPTREMIIFKIFALPCSGKQSATWYSASLYAMSQTLGGKWRT